MVIMTLLSEISIAQSSLKNQLFCSVAVVLVLNSLYTYANFLMLKKK